MNANARLSDLLPIFSRAALRGGPDPDNDEGQCGYEGLTLQVDNPRVGAGLCAGPVIVTSDRASV